MITAADNSGSSSSSGGDNRDKSARQPKGSQPKAASLKFVKRQPTTGSTLCLLVVILIAIATTCLLLVPQNGLVDYQNPSASRSSLVGLTLNGYVRDPLLFVAANYLLDLSNYLAHMSQPSISDSEQGNTLSNCSFASKRTASCDELQPVSGHGWLKTDKLKRLVKGDKQHREIPDYSLDQQPDPQRVTHIDADLRTCLDPARAQLDCGACYAFSWNSLVEWHYCKQTGSRLDLSEQHIIDCSDFGGFDRCKSGKIEDVRVFAVTFGFYLEQEYPYTARYKGQSMDKCKNTRLGRRFRVFDWKRLIVDRQEWERVLEEQPILVQAHLPSDIMGYKGGIHPGNNCNDRMLHGMLLVGHGREDGRPYWLIRNTMGPKWGEGGHFRLARDDSSMSQCFSTGWIGKFKFDSVDADEYDEFYSQIQFEPSEHILPPKKSLG